MNVEQGRDQAAERIAELLGELKELIGPGRCDHEDCACADDLPEKLDNVMPTEWLTVIQWTDFDSGESYNTMISAPTMLRSHQRGLLMDWVDMLSP